MNVEIGRGMAQSPTTFRQRTITCGTDVTAMRFAADQIALHDRRGR